MKQFNVKDYLENPDLKVVTRDGKTARIVCTDAKGAFPVVALIYSETEKSDHAHRFKEDGSFTDLPGCTNHYDLFFATTKHEGWVNVYRSNDARTGTNFELGAIYPTKEEALKHMHFKCCIHGITYADTIYIEWED